MQQFIAFNDFNSDGRLLSLVLKNCIHDYANVLEDLETALPCGCIISLIGVWQLLLRSTSVYSSVNAVSLKLMNIDLYCFRLFFCRFCFFSSFSVPFNLKLFHIQTKVTSILEIQARVNSQRSLFNRCFARQVP